MTNPRPCRLLLMLMCWLILGSSLTGCGLTLGPTTEVRYLVVHPGQPLRVMEQTTVTGERLDGGGPASFDVGGWVMMPPDHWVVVEKLIKKAQPDVAPTVK